MKKILSFIIGLLLLFNFIPDNVFAMQREDCTYAANQSGGVPDTDSEMGSGNLGGDPWKQTQKELGFSDDRVLVKLANTSRARSTTLDLGVGYSEIHMLNPSKQTNELEVFTTKGINDTQNNTFVLTLEETGPDAVERALEVLNANPAVEIAEPDYIYELCAEPNDLMYNAQYALEKISAPQAWDITTGRSSVVIGIIDSGIDSTHPDLQPNLWRNPNPNQNGYVNDIHGYNFTGYDPTTNSITGPKGGNPTDAMGHGTHVAGIVGATGNNGEGVCGVNWDVSLAWLGIHNGSLYVLASAAIEALNYANNHDILITNNSYGGPHYSKIFEQAILNYKGLFIVAAGNNSLNNDVFLDYPSGYNCPNIISVASTDESDELSHFSNYGENSVDIAAPGSSILSTYRNGTYTDNGRHIDGHPVCGWRRGVD